MKWSLSLVATVACTTPPPVTPANQCPARDDLAKQLAQPVELDLRILDNFSWGTSCAATPQHVVSVKLDNAPWCSVTVPCTTTMQAPPRSFACTGVPVKPGARTLGVEIDAQPSTLMLRTMSLPAFDYTSDGALFLGAHVLIWVEDKTILIDPPTASEQLMM